VPQWDWTRIVGTHFAERDDPYFCLGDSGPCEVPQTETPGPFEVAFEDDLLQSMLEPDVAHELALRTFGDNDDGDCEHTAFAIEVEMWVLE